MKDAAVRPREFTGRHMLILMLSFFAVIIAVNATFAVLANKTWSGLIVANGYDASQNFNKDEALGKEQALLGWQVNVIHKNGVLSIAMTGKDGRPLTGLTVAAALRRTVTDKQDSTLAFTETAAGTYTTAAKVASGKWEIDVKASDAQGHSFARAYRFVALGG